ncbi:MAG: acyl-CoA dehydrogenase family protein [Microbacterium sp.]
MVLTTDELEQFTATARQFIDKRLIPIEQQVDLDENIDADLWKSLVAESAELGFYTANVPESLGGPGLTVSEQTRLWEEFGRTSWTFSYLLARPHRALMSCNEDQRQRFLEPVMSGEKEACFALTEPGAGSDNSAMSTRAEKVDGGYRITGSKHFISHGDADIAVVFAVTGPPLRGRTPQITAFIVEKATPGYTVGRVQRMMGWNGMHEHELLFDDCFVPNDQVLGEPGQGLKIALTSVALRRLQIAAHCVGAMNRLVDVTVDYVRNRVAFDHPLSDKQGVQWKLADIALDAHISREAVRSAAEACDRARAEGKTDLQLSSLLGKEISIAKLQASTALNRVVDVAVQLHGGMGWAKETVVERLYRDARAFRIVEGADEVHRTIISRALLAEAAKH